MRGVGGMRALGCLLGGGVPWGWLLQEIPESRLEGPLNGDTCKKEGGGVVGVGGLDRGGWARKRSTHLKAVRMNNLSQS